MGKSKGLKVGTHSSQLTEKIARAKAELVELRNAQKLEREKAKAERAARIVSRKKAQAERILAQVAKTEKVIEKAKALNAKRMAKVANLDAEVGTAQ